MGLKTGGYATIWSVEDKGKFSNVRLSTSRKNQDGEYVTDYSGYARFIGEAHNLASSLKEKDRIKVGDIEVTNSYNKETKKVEYTNVALFSFEMADGTGTATKKDTAAPADKKAPAKAKPKPLEEDDEDSLPFK
jgi:predicted component of type VI protein secretion system